VSLTHPTFTNQQRALAASKYRARIDGIKAFAKRNSRLKYSG